MYFGKELSWLALHKEVTRRRISVRRSRCEQAADEIGHPLRRIDRAVSYFRSVAPYLAPAKVPITLFAARSLISKKGWLRLALRWSPVAWALVSKNNPQPRIFVLSALRFLASNGRRWLQK